jgi:methionyl aminopeptidase
VSISIKSDREIAIMRQAGRIVGNTLQQLRQAIEPGMTTRDIDRMCERLVKRQGGIPAFPYVNDFPGSACISVNEEVVHGTPGKRRIRAGDLVKIDVGALYDGYHGDAALTVMVGAVSDSAHRLVDITERALAAGIAAAGNGVHLNAIGAAVEDIVLPAGYSIVREYAGHGIGRELHEDPSVSHHRQQARGIRLRPGMTLTIEPMVNAGTSQTRTQPDGWTVVTEDGRLSAQFEHTILITEAGAEILTLPDQGSAWGVSLQATNSVQYT